MSHTVGPARWQSGGLVALALSIGVVGSAGAQTVPALRPGSGLSGTSAAASLERDGPRFAGPRSEAGPTHPAATAPKRVGDPFRFRDDEIRIPDAQDVAFLTETRPVRVRLQVRVAGGTLASEWKGRLGKLFEFFDRDGDGGLNAYETEFVFSNRGVQQMIALGAASPAFTDPGRGLADFDRDGDGRISFDEFLAYYNPSAGKLVALRPNVNRDPYADALTGGLFKLFDRDHDGKLSREELASTEGLLRARDGDEDECLSAMELVPDLVGRGGGRAPAPRTTPDAGNVLQVYPAGGIPETILEQLLTRYDRDKNLRLKQSEVGMDDETFNRLDRNGNRELTVTELLAWRDGPPDLTVELTLGAKPSGSAAKVLPGPDGKRPPLASALKLSEPGKAFLRVGNQQLEFNTYAPQGVYARPVQQAVAGVQFPDKGRGFITEKEVAQAGPQLQYLRVLFDTVDRDADGKMTRAEFDAYFQVQQGFQSLPLSVNHAAQTPSLFQLLDVNADGRLSVRELRSAFARMRDLEPGGGDLITKAAVQPQGVIQFGRSLQVNLPVTSVAFNPRVVPPTKGPLWFRKMDRNADGELSKAEFLGRAEEFARLDADRDGQISPDEATAADTALRASSK